jgi:hypothetical protein
MSDNGGMDSTPRRRNRYDHRLCDLVRSTGNIEHATRRGIPRSTARSWLSSRHSGFVTLDVVDQDRQRLQQEVLACVDGPQGFWLYYGSWSSCGRSPAVPSTRVAFPVPAGSGS